MKTEIFLREITINAVKQNAGVFYGENSARGWKTRFKFNAALGRVNGDGNVITSRINLVNDPDVIDMSNGTPNA